MNYSDNRQLKILVDQGLTLEEAAESLGMHPDAARLAMASGRKVKSIAEMIEDFKPEAAKLLMDIARYGENESARVASLKILMTGEGILPDASASELSKRLENMRKIQQSQEPAQLIELTPA